MSPSASSWTPLHVKLHSLLLEQQLLSPKASILIAVSGGQDSLCLLRLLLDLKSKFDWYLAIAHCDHLWSTDTGIAAHVEKIAYDVQLPFYLKTNPCPSQESEAAARNWRYQALTEIAEEFNFSFLVTGHTSSDRSETLLYNLIRGSGADGLVSLGWRRPLTKKITLVRPLLSISRQETGDFCKYFQLPVWEDLANENLRYARNRLRQVVIPYLKTNFHPQVEKNLAQTAELLTEEVIFLQNYAEDVLKKALIEKKTINRIILQDYPLAIQRRVIRLFLLPLLPKMPNFDHIESVTSLISAPNLTCTSSLPGGAIAQTQGKFITLV
jgi:tRNA(Ile)-lysidine synthase